MTLMQNADGLETLSLRGDGLRIDFFPQPEDTSILAIRSHDNGTMTSEWIESCEVEELKRCGMEECHNAASSTVLRAAARAFHPRQ